VKIFHIINPYQTKPDSEDESIQKRTLDSIDLARNYIKELVPVNILAKVDIEEVDYFNSKFDNTDIYICPLNKLSKDLDINFKVPRRLPLLNDLITLPETLISTIDDNDYLIFTNMDICIQPYFYAEVSQMIKRGFSCFVINRRTVDKSLLNQSLANSFTSDGDKHIGHDCFILPAKLLKKFKLKEHILGIGFVFRPFLLNCIIHSESFHEFEDLYMTYHYGDDMTWKNDKYSDYLDHNKQMMIDVFTENLEFIKNLPKEKQKWIEKFFPFDFLPKYEFNNA
jgi:hypothetical protein